MAAEARPVALPLAGGVPGATVRVHPLLTAEALAPPAFTARPTGRLALLRGLAARRSRWTWVPIGAFLVEHPGAGLLLVDTGLRAGVAGDPRPELGRRHQATLRVRMEPGQSVAGQLRARGVEPTAVDAVVMTHLHYDHASGLAELPDATYLVDRREWAAATSRGFISGYRRRLLDQAFDWRALDFEGPDVEAFATFGRSLDLFGDGSLRLVSTRGHTPGHLSVVARLSQRELVLAGDAAPSLANIEAQRPGLFLEDEHLFRRSLRELHRYLQVTPEALIICSHDADLWPVLDPVYA